MRIKPLLARLAFLTAGMVPGLVLAHYPWMTPAEYMPDAGQSVEFSVGWGHAFPGTETLDATRLESVQLIWPSTGRGAG